MTLNIRVQNIYYELKGPASVCKCLACHRIFIRNIESFVLRIVNQIEIWSEFVPCF